MSASPAEVHEASHSPVIARRLRTRYLAAQVAGDQRAALTLVDDALAAGVAPDLLRVEVIQAAQREIGRLWQENQLSVAHEHMATAISQLALARLFAACPPRATLHRKVLLACVEGEQHCLPLRLVADALELAGFDVRCLGANVPTESLVALAAAERPHLLGLSVTMSFNLGALRHAVPRLRAALPGVPVLVGGHALTWSPGLAAELGVIACPPDTAALVDAARALALTAPAAEAHA